MLLDLRSSSKGNNIAGSNPSVSGHGDQPSLDPATLSWDTVICLHS